jgi:hypothetical protein
MDCTSCPPWAQHHGIASAGQGLTVGGFCCRAQEGPCGPGWPFPEGLQFLNKNSRFLTAGRRSEGFRLLARAVRQGRPDSSGGSGAPGGEVVLAQAASAPFKVRGLPLLQERTHMILCT